MTLKVLIKMMTNRTNSFQSRMSCGKPSYLHDLISPVSQKKYSHSSWHVHCTAFRISSYPFYTRDSPLVCNGHVLRKYCATVGGRWRRQLIGDGSAARSGLPAAREVTRRVTVTSPRGDLRRPGTLIDALHVTCVVIDKRTILNVFLTLVCIVKWLRIGIIVAFRTASYKWTYFSDNFRFSLFWLCYRTSLFL